MPAAQDDRSRLETLRGFTRLLASETGVEPLSQLILDALAGAVGRPYGVLYGPAGADGAREVLASRDPTPPTGSAARAGELRIPLVLAGEEVAVAVLRDRADVDAEGDGALVREMAVQAAAALRAALTVRQAQRLTTISRAVLDAVRDGIGLVDDQGRVVLRNERLVQLSRGVPPLPLGAVDASDGPRSDEFQVRPTRQRFARYTEPVCDPAGECLGRVVVLRDITREHDVEQRKDELIATIAHELRGPLAVISGSVELLATRVASEQERRRQLEIVLAESRRLHGLIDDLLDLERLELGAVGVRADVFDVAVLLEEQVELHGVVSTRHRVELDVAQRPLRVCGDRDRISQVVGNLLSNALKYSPGGGIIRVAASAASDEVTIMVADPGLGIPSEDQPRIFERFFRAEADRHREIEGSGLGLALCRQIVLAHGGTLDFQSVPGRGSRFWFTLPLPGRPIERRPGVSAEPWRG